jgi:hypothetical protein
LRTILWNLLLKLLGGAEFGLFTSKTPQGKRLGGHDVPNVEDKFFILTIGLDGLGHFVGYFQTA